MRLPDILVHLDSFPEVTPDAGIDQAVEFARLVGGQVTALAAAVDIPLQSNRVADYLIGLSKLEKEEEAKSLRACHAAVERFTAQAKAAGVFADAKVESCVLYAVAQMVAERARTRDLCIVPFGGGFDGQAEVAATVVFDSGRPVLIYRAQDANFAGGALGEVVVAWDGGRAAARAMGDALPILAKAKSVRVLSVINEKPGTKRGSGAEAVRHLQSHGLTVALDEVDAAGRPIGDVLNAYLKERRPDLLVMGAYGHSRLREFILGGATEHVLQGPPVPVLLSH